MTLDDVLTLSLDSILLATAVTPAAIAAVIPQPILGPFPVVLSTPGLEPTDIVLAQGSAFCAPNGGSHTWTILDATGDAVSFAGKAIALVISVLPGSTAVVTYTSGDGEITVGGTDNNLISVKGGTEATTAARRLCYTLWNTTDNVAIREGKIRVAPATHV